MADNSTRIVLTAVDQTQQAFASVRSSVDGLSKSLESVGFGSLAGAITALVSAGTFKALVTDTISMAAGLDDMAERTGASVEALSGLARVAKISGVDLGTVEHGLIRLTKALSDGDEESKGAGKALAFLGLEAEKLRGMDTAAAMLEVAKALDQYADGSGKTALAIALLGKNGAALLPYLKDLAEVGELQGKVTAEQAAAAEKLEKEWRKVTSIGGGELRKAVLDNIESFAMLVDVVRGALTAFKQFGSSFAVVVNDIATGIAIVGHATLGGGLFGNTLAQQKIQEALAARSRFVQAANEDMQDRFNAFSAGSVTDQVKAALAGGSASKPQADFVGKGKKEEKVEEEEELNPLDLMYGGYPGAYKDFVNAIKINAANIAAQLAMDEEMQRAHAKRVSDIVTHTESGKLEVRRTMMQEAATLFQEGAITEQQWLEYSAERSREWSEKTKDEFDSLARAIEGWGRDSANAIVEFATTGKASFGDLVTSILKDIARMAVYENVTKPLFSALNDGIKGSGFGDWLKGVFGGARAGGGPVSAGRAYLVGERGPELFVPGASGGIVPNGAGGGLVVNLIEAPKQAGQVQQRNDNGANVLDIFVDRIRSTLAADIAGGRGPLPAALSNTYGLNRAAGAY